MKRCNWANANDLYVNYHDIEWGVPVHEDIKLFEMLILEGSQAGLSWLTILKRREAYRMAYNGFDPQAMSQWDNIKIEGLLKDPSIIRNRLKINAAKANALAYLEILDEYNSFDTFIWSFVNGVPVQNEWRDISQIPATTPESDAMSKELKRRGFKFVGSTICYAFMQSVGMVNDHVVNCFRYNTLKGQ